MANREHAKVLGRGLATWNAWREEHGDILPDLSGADLSKAVLKGAKLDNAMLARTNLLEAQMSKALLSHAELRNAWLKGAILADAEMDNANLRDAGLEGANLNSAILQRADLSGANLRRATLIKTGLNGADLSRADLTGADLSGAYLIRTDLTRATLKNATLCGAVLEGALLVETDLTDVDISKSRVYGISVWNTKGEPKNQSSLIVSHQGESEILVDSLEMAHFIYLMVNHKNLRKMLNSVTERGVLLLGPFEDGGLKFLQRIASERRKNNYLPIIFDFERPGKMDYTETVTTLVGLSRFVIAELSGPSVSYELGNIVSNHALPFVSIGQKGKRRFSMIDDLKKYPWFLDTVEYSTVEELITCLRKKDSRPG